MSQKSSDFDFLGNERITIKMFRNSEGGVLGTIETFRAVVVRLLS